MTREVIVTSLQEDSDGVWLSYGTIMYTESWCWNNVDDNAIKEKRRLYRKSGKQVIAKNIIWKQNVRQCQKFILLRNRLWKERFPNMLRQHDEKGEIFKITKQMAGTKYDVVGEKCSRNDHGDLAFDDCAKEKVAGPSSIVVEIITVGNGDALE